MKKFFKLLGLSFITFILAFNVSAGVCDGANVRDIVTVTPYNPTGWNAWAYVCQYTNCRDQYTQCDKADESAAKNWCKGTYQKPGYKNYNHTVSVGQCADSNVCACTNCKATCTVKTTTYTTHTVACNPAVRDDCICVSSMKPVNDGISCTRTYTTSSTSTVTKDLVSTYTGDSCASKSDLSNFQTKAKADLDAQCNAYDTGDNVEVSISGKECTDAFRVKYKVCDCASKPYEVQNVREAKYAVKNTNISVYCINPADEPPTKVHVNSFDATQCESSNSTAECGFSNILIESEYRRKKGNSNYNYAVTGAAMRLWSAHFGISGFKDTGIADEDDTTIDSDGSWLHYVPGPNIKGPYLNVFKATLEHFAKDYGYRNVKTVYEVDTVSGNGTSNLTTIACSRDRMGIFCSGDTGNYMYALALYANTLQGNKDMIKHLNELNFQNNPEALQTVKNDPISYTTTILDKTTVRVTYKLRENVEIECSTLPDEEKNSAACKVEQQAIVKDKYGNVLGSANITEYDYCHKNYCYVDVVFTSGVLNCNVIDKFVLKAQVTKNCGANSIKSYYACSNPSEHQIMYSYEPDSNCSDNTTTTEYMESTFKCNLCDDDASASVKACDSTSPVTNTVSDPSLNCILHKTSGSSTNITSKTSKHIYDYSDTFKVNTDICRVYCSDKVNYKVSGRKTVPTSFQLSYDIERDLGLSKSGDNRLVSIIEMERDCVSEIFYDEPFDYVKDWSKAYGLGNVKIDNWQDLYNALAEKSKDENNREELLNKLAYDLYNCNFYTDAQMQSIVGDKVKKPLDSVNSYGIAKELLNNTKQYCQNNDCVTGYFMYEGGAEFINAKSSDELRVGSTANNPYLESYTDVKTSSIIVEYCDKGECFRQIDGKYSKEDFSEAGSSKLSSGNISVLGVKVPTNDYAIFSIKVVNNVYNPVRYQVQQGTGKIQIERNEDKDKYFTIDKNTFPVSSYAYNICTRDGNGNTATCKVTHQYSIPAYTDYKGSFGKKQILFSRNSTDDNFLDKLKEANTYSCDYKVKGIGDDCIKDADCPREGFIFRNIDLADPVPVEREGTNWDANNENDPTYSNYVGGVINEIKESANQNLYATDYYLEYSFVLDATAIEEIRSNNKVSNYFALPNSCKLEDGMYLGCKSSFLNDVRTSHKYSIIVKKGDGISQYTEEKDKFGGAN